ncbi:bud neck involved protein [Xylographa trunciseda]|nr:bud neck involved protein [Xylographa trunciseda]
MAALVQSFPQQSSTVTMLQTRHDPASNGPFLTSRESQQQLRNSPLARGIYGVNSGVTTYRGHTSVPPIAPYAFATTPIASQAVNPLRQNPTVPYLRQEDRTFSAPVVTSSQQNSFGGSTNQTRQRQTGSSPTIVPAQDIPNTLSNTLKSGTRDDSAIMTPRTTTPRPMSAMELNLSDAKLSALGTNAKPLPDRYRRPQRRADAVQPVHGAPQNGGSALPSGSGMATVGHLYNQPMQFTSGPAQQQQMYRGTPMLQNPEGTSPFGTTQRIVSKDDMMLNRQTSSEQAKRYRRRSVGGMEVGEYTSRLDPKERSSSEQLKTYASVTSSHYVPEKQLVRSAHPIEATIRPVSHGRTGSDESASSFNSIVRPSSSKRETVGVAPSNPTVMHGTAIAKHEAKLVNIPPRGSSDANKRIATPSPLSRPMAFDHGSSASKTAPSAQQPPRALQPQPTPQTNATAIIPESPAAQHLAALNKKEGKKEGKSSRLRRAFSFGSAAELRKASAENSHNNNVSAERAKLRKDRLQDEHDAAQAAIVQKQEAGGLGEGIYSGQGQFFTGSTDNLSISSTASSASVMLRKMGKGVKKSTRSLVGLFRPKSVIGVPAADAAVPGPSLAQVSMVTVEAEREKVNVNVDPHDQAGGGTGFPRLERNSLDAASAAAVEPSLSFSDWSSDNTNPRRSIVGGEKERAEVLAAVKKGILKRNESGGSSPLSKPVDSKYTEFVLPQIPRMTDSPNSSAPSTPGDDRTPRGGHRRTDSISIDGEDYFMSVARFADSGSKSIPGTPRSISSRNISFSPRIQFHDTWPSGEYDRRGEIATCNRLTPMLAQQIKEELNSFKMEMEVHEESKLNTHFF